MTVHIIIPVAHTKFLIETGLVGAHVWNSPSILVAHMENHAVEFQISIKAYWTVSAVKIEGDVGELGPPLLLKITVRMR